MPALEIRINSGKIMPSYRSMINYMKNNTLLWLAGLIAGLCCHGHAAEDDGWIEAGVRGGISASSKNKDFEQYELFTAYRLNPRWEWRSGWVVQTQIGATLGELRSEQQTGVILSVGPKLTFSKPGSALSVDVGISPTYISETRYGVTNLGGNTQFISHLRLSYQFSDPFSVGIRFHHMSNGRLQEANPGLNIQSLELSYQF